ncbi:MAG: hypothetical protein GY913_03160 [Proteobacteria bacterium]|nr:hypothetical protein [Pseudomonadota bacterium]MCP4915899.1 hypothetical protein [Pseudomonadota bacterium]
MSLLLFLACPAPQDGAPANDSAPIELPDVVTGAQWGDPGIASAHRIAFGPQGYLAIGDGENDRIVVVKVPDEDAIDGDFTEIDDLVSTVADATGGNVGTTEVTDVSVHPDSNRTYVSATVGNQGVVLTVGEDGTLGLLDLSDVEYVVIPYPTVDDVGSAVSDLAWTESHVVAAVTEWTWSPSQVVTIERPLAHESTAGVASTETYHRTHGNWETMAPITTLFAYEDGDTSWVGASYQCAPVVRFDVQQLAGGGEVVGETPFDYGGGRQVVAFEIQGDQILGAIYGLGDGNTTFGRVAGTDVDVSYFFAEEIDEEATIAFDRQGDEKCDYAQHADEIDKVWRFGVLGDDRVVAYLDGGLVVVSR